VIYVSWNDAVAYAGWLSAQTGKRYRLPTEAEWNMLRAQEPKLAIGGAMS
jgi:formylglycine-generating enzyme required for sulfatase activity